MDKMSAALERVYEDLHADIQRKLAEDIQFHVHLFAEEDGSITATVEEFDLVVNGKDERDARLLLILEIMDYAKDYVERYADYSQAPNRKDHIRYLMAIAMQPNIQSVLNLFDA